MDATPPQQAVTTSASTDAQARRELALRRAYQRQLRRKPTLLEKNLIARLVKAELRELDAESTPNWYRAHNIAEDCRAAFNALIAKADAKPATPDLRAYLLAKQSKQAASA
jgi:hypothetical protein